MFHKIENPRGPKNKGVPGGDRACLSGPHCGGAVGNDASLMPLGGGFQGAGIPFIYNSRPSAFLFPPGGPQAEKCSEQT